MRLKAALAILALVSAGMNFSPASLCAFHCGWSPTVDSVHQLQMEAQPPRAIAGGPAAAGYHVSHCADCGSDMGISLAPAVDCPSLIPMSEPQSAQWET